MPQFYDHFPDHLQEWALRQPLFFTSSAPLTGRHVNVSPKGLTSSTFAIFDRNHAGYVDATGSGVETISHIYDNRRVTIMFCSFDKNPRILRLFCRGTVVEVDDPDFENTVHRIGKKVLPGARAIILLDIWKVQTSCGYGVPMINDFKIGASDGETSISKSEHVIVPACDQFSDRHTLRQWVMGKIEKNTLEEYRANKNARSLDGLLGLRTARKSRGEVLFLLDAGAFLSRKLDHPEAVIFGMILGIGLLLLASHLQWGVSGSSLLL